MKYFIIFPLLMIFPLFGQDISSIIKESSFSFTLSNNGTLNGAGADSLLLKINDSHFFLLGEQHNIQAIEELTTHLIPLLKKEGYTIYATEIGPFAAEKILTLKKNNQSLLSYYCNYIPLLGFSPFGFFSTQEEERTLEAVIEHKMDLWGIDFDNYGSYLSLVNEMYLQSEQGKILPSEYKETYAFIANQYQQAHNGYNPTLMQNILESDLVNNFLKLARNMQNTPLIEQFILSLKINNEQAKGFWEGRVINMKHNFSTYYRKATAKGVAPKVFMKMGAIHTSRGTSFNGNIDIGNMIYELANFNGQKSFSVISFPRYILENGEILDTIEEENKILLSYTSPTNWTFIDLHTIKQLSIEQKIQLPQTIIVYLQKFDALLIPPATQYSLNFER